MCVSCGGGEIRNNHGDSHHLTREVIQQAADAAGLSVEQVVRSIQTSMRQAESHPTSARQEPKGPESISGEHIR
jgi:hypothetical protein